MSARDEAVLWLTGRKGNGAGGATAGGGNVLLKTAKHKLDGPEHTTPDDTTTLDATTDRHGLLPKLSGDADAFLNGEGEFVVPSFATDLDGLTDVVTTGAVAGVGLFFDGAVWRPAYAPVPLILEDGFVAILEDGSPAMTAPEFV